MLYDLVDGKVGRVIEGEVCESLEDWGKERRWNGEEFFCGDEDWVIVEGKKYLIGNEVERIDEVEFNMDDVILFREDGYRGRVCYNGVVKIDGKWYWLDIVGEYMVYEMEEYN